MDIKIVNLFESRDLMETAASILHSTFQALESSAWTTYELALAEVEECIQEPNVAIGLLHDNELKGWVGIRPMYNKVWELHPLVVSHMYQGAGLGRELMKQIEHIAREKGLLGLLLGSDDEDSSTTLSQNEITKENIFSAMMNIKNLKKHPFEFYEKCGYTIVGIVPNASGKNKPDIWMWKNLEE